MELLSGRKVVVLASHSVSLDEKPVELRSSKPVEISGSLSSICFVLKDGVSMQDVNAMERIFADAVGGARLSAALIFANGDRVVLGRPSVSWSAKGIVLRDGELAACAAPPCGRALPIGAVATKVEVSSVPAFTVMGVYWKSERDPSEPLLPSVTTSPTAQSTSSTKGCSSTR